MNVHLPCDDLPEIEIVYLSPNHDAALKKQKIVYSTDGEIEDVVDVHVAQYMYTVR